MTDTVRKAGAEDSIKRKDFKVISASSLGTMFEWYDFYLYGLLARTSPRISFRA